MKHLFFLFALFVSCVVFGQTLPKNIPDKTQPKTTTTTKTSTIPEKPEVIFVKGGTFQMGSNSGESDAKPVHSVTVSDFSIGKYEVTVAQYTI